MWMKQTRPRSSLDRLLVLDGLQDIPTAHSVLLDLHVQEFHVVPVGRRRFGKLHHFLVGNVEGAVGESLTAR